MCRHLAYLGVPVPLGALLIEPEYGLLRQSWAPRRQRHGVVNADGFGVGWYADGDPIPARYRSERPMWADPSLLDLARVVRSGAVLAAVRSATRPEQLTGAGGAAPFAAGRHLFSHNGAVPGWPASAAVLAEGLPVAELLGTLGREASTDSAVLWALVEQRLAAGAGVAEAAAGVVAHAAASTGGRLNLLLTDGTQIVGTTWGDTLSYRADDRGVVVASEPYDDGSGWVDVPDRSLLVARPDGVTVESLDKETVEPSTRRPLDPAQG
jgi:gamma-glutamyl hercynylcysteine S-oxide hydrolase